jgi:dTDP-4-dehydrorhamnose 3,5-epimerase
MNIVRTEIAGVVLIEPKVFGDARGFFVETWQSGRYAEAGLPAVMVQDNVSRSSKGVLRGLHYQWPHPQGKLVFVLEGEIVDVAVDIRRGSPTFGRSVTARLSSDDKRQIYVPPGFAHGFHVTSPTALVTYKCTEIYRPEFDRGIRWNDPRLGIAWQAENPQLSAKDAGLPLLADVPADLLPRYEERD